MQTKALSDARSDVFVLEKNILKHENTVHITDTKLRKCFIIIIICGSVMRLLDFYHLQIQQSFC